MDVVFNVLLVIHIVSGSLGLITGTINIIRRKGDHLHRRIGNIFLITMVAAGISSIALAIIHPNTFLAIVGILSIYLTATGKRFLAFRNPLRKAKLIDWSLTATIVTTGIILFIWGIRLLLVAKTFGIVFLGFGFIAGLFARADWKMYRAKERRPMSWLSGHLQRLTGGYISALTASLVVNGNILPPIIPAFIVWLFPTVILVPFIIRWSRKYAPN